MAYPSKSSWSGMVVFAALALEGVFIIIVAVAGLASMFMQ